MHAHICAHNHMCTHTFAYTHTHVYTHTPLLTGIVLGKHSGRNALNTRLKALGYNTGIAELDDVFK